MNTGLLIISNMPAPDVAASPSSSNHPDTSNTERFALPPSDNALPANTSEAAPADNINANTDANTNANADADANTNTNASNKTTSQPNQCSNHSVDEKVKHQDCFAAFVEAQTAQEPKTSDDETKIAAKTSTLQAVNPAQFVSAQESAVTVDMVGKSIDNPSQQQPTVQTADKPATLVTVPETGQSSKVSQSPIVKPAPVPLVTLLSTGKPATLLTASETGQSPKVSQSPIVKPAPVPLVTSLGTGKPAALLTASETGQSPKVSQSHIVKPAPVPLVTSLGTDKPVQSTVDQSQNDTSAVSHNTSTAQLVPNSQSAEGKNAPDIQLLDKASISKENLVMVENAGKLVPESHTTNSKPVTADENPTNDKTSTGQQGRIISELPADGTSRQPAIARHSSLESQVTGHKSQVTSHKSPVTVSSSADTSSASAERSSVSASKPADTASSSELSTGVGKQIQESIYSSLRTGEQRITIRLNPPELGEVTIKFQEQDGQIIGLLEVAKAQTRAEIQNALPQIIQNLATDGVVVKRLEVLLTNQQAQPGFKDQSFAAGSDGWSGQRSSANPDSQPENPDWVEPNGWLTNDRGYAEFAEPQLQVTNGSINMLV